MATYYVDSAAGGANNGSSWTDAWASIDSAFANPLAAGDIVLLDDGHSEALGTKNYTTGGTPGNMVQILSVDKADDTASVGATLTITGNLDLNDSNYLYGITATISGYFGFPGNANDYQIYDTCTISTGNGHFFGYTSASEQRSVVKNCTLINTGNNTKTVSFAGRLEWEGGTYSGANAGINPDYSNSGCLIVGVDLTDTLTGVFQADDAAEIGGEYIASRCEIASGVVVVNGTPTKPQSSYALYHSQDGTDSDPSYALDYEDYFGTIQVDTARYRTGGASDGVRSNPFSWEMTSSANTKEIISPLSSPYIYGWSSGDGSTAVTYSIFIASGITYQNDEIWVDFEFPNSLNTSSLTELISTRLAPNGTPSNLTTDTSTWTGSGVGTIQKITITHTPDKAGPVMAKVRLGRASVTAYIDPIIYLTPAVSGAARGILIPTFGSSYEGDAASGSGGGATKVMPVPYYRF